MIRFWLIATFGPCFCLALADANGAVQYSQDFNSFPNGTTDLGDGSILFNSQGTVEVVDGALRLTRDDVNSQDAFYKLPPMDLPGFVAQFDFLLFDAPGGNPPADGFSFNFGSIADDVIGSENGFGSGIAIAFDTWDNSAPDATENDIGFDVIVDGATIASLPEPLGAGPSIVDDQFHTVQVEYANILSAPGGLLNVALDGEALFSNILVPFEPAGGERFAFASRTGGANELLLLDNVTIADRSAIAEIPEPATFVVWGLLAVTSVGWLQMPQRRRA